MCPIKKQPPFLPKYSFYFHFNLTSLQKTFFYCCPFLKVWHRSSSHILYSILSEICLKRLLPASFLFDCPLCKVWQSSCSKLCFRASLSCVLILIDFLPFCLFHFVFLWLFLRFLSFIFFLIKVFWQAVPVCWDPFLLIFQNPATELRLPNVR